MREYIKINKGIYDFLAEEYERRISDYRISDRLFIDPFINLLKKKYDEIHLLELGPGSGLDLSFFNEAEFKTTAIEISKKIIEVGKKISPETNFICNDFLSHDFGDLKFEGIFAKAFIHLFPKEDFILVLEKIRNLLNPEGFLFISTTAHFSSREGFYGKLDFPGQPKRFRRKWAERDLMNFLIQGGFEILGKKYYYEKKRGKKWVNFYLRKL